MAGIFISYSRKDKEFVRRLHDALKAAGHEPWVDWEGIQPGAEWLKEIYSAIDAAHVFLFILTPDAVDSEVCGQEVAHAVANHKRLIPVVYRDVNAREVHKAAAAHNWIFCRESDDFEVAFQSILKAIDTDLDWLHAHTRLLTRALDWQSHNRDNSFALRGQDLQKAEQWLAKAVDGKEPRATPLQTQFILASRRDSSRRQRTMFEAVAIGTLISLLLGFLTWDHARKARVYQAREMFTQAMWALADKDVPKAEVMLAQSLTLDDQKETRERFIEAHATVAPLAWTRRCKQDDRTLAVSADGRRFAVRDAQQRLHLWDVAQRREIAELPAMGAKAQCMAFHKNDKIVATGDEDGVIHIWNVDSGQSAKLRHTLRGHSRAVRCIAFSPDGKLLVTSGKSLDVRVWDVKTGRSLLALRGHRDQVLSLAFTPDSKTLASGTKGSDVWLWDMASGQKIRELRGHKDAVFGLNFSPDGRTLASASWDTTVWLWDVKTGIALRQLHGHQSGVLSVLFSHDGREILTSGEDGTARIWNAESGQEELTLRGQVGYLRYVALGMGERELVAGSDEGTVRVWNVADAARHRELMVLHGHTNYVRTIAFSPDGKFIATGSEDLSVRVWDASKGRLLRTMKGHTRGIFSLFFRRDSQRFATASKDFTVREWDVNTGACTQVLSHSAAVRHVEYAPNAPLIAVACDDTKIYLWNSETSKLLRVLSAHTETALCVAFSADGRILATGGEDRRIVLWDVQSGKKIASLRGHGGPVWDLAFRHDGQRLYSASEDETIRVWDMTTRLPVDELRGHNGPVWDVSWNAQRQTLASAGQDSSVRLWQFAPDTDKVQDTLVLRASTGPMWWVDWSQNGEHLAASSEDRTARVWNLAQVQKLLEAHPKDLLQKAQEDTGLHVEGNHIVSDLPTPTPLAE